MSKRRKTFLSLLWNQQQPPADHAVKQWDTNGAQTGFPLAIGVQPVDIVNARGEGYLTADLSKSRQRDGFDPIVAPMARHRQVEHFQETIVVGYLCGRAVQGRITTR